MSPVLRVISFRQPGRVVPRRAAGLAAAAVRLRCGEQMAWHSTKAREELLLVLEGRVVLEVERSGRRPLRRALGAGSCALIPSQMWHRVRNPSRPPARYLYVTAPAR